MFLKNKNMQGGFGMKEFEAKVTSDSYTDTISYEIPNEIYNGMQIDDSQREKQAESGII
jgi:hypothetical protein